MEVEIIWNNKQDRPATGAEIAGLLDDGKLFINYYPDASKRHHGEGIVFVDVGVNVNDFDLRAPVCSAEPPLVEEWCYWIEDEEGVWVSQCDKMFVLTDGQPPKNHEMMFCCFCGKQIGELTIEAKYSY
jgi:hypothetical protein